MKDSWVQIRNLTLVDYLRKLDLKVTLVLQILRTLKVLQLDLSEIYIVYYTLYADITKYPTIINKSAMRNKIFHCSTNFINNFITFT